MTNFKELISIKDCQINYIKFFLLIFKEILKENLELYGIAPFKEFIKEYFTIFY